MMFYRHQSLFLLVTCCGLLTTSSLFAQKKPAAQQAAVVSRVAESTSIEREQIALDFAKRHHPELSLLLSQLKEMDHRKYTAAINELSRTHDRLARYQERTPARYQTELAIWKIDSRVRLLVARSVSGMEDETRQQMKNLLTKRNQLRVEQLISERDRLNDRLQRLDEQIASLNDDAASDAAAEREVDRLMRSVQARSSSRKKKAATRTQSTETETVRAKKSNAANVD